MFFNRSEYLRQFVYYFLYSKGGARYSINYKGIALIYSKIKDKTIKHFLISCMHLELKTEDFLKVKHEQCLRMVKLLKFSLNIHLIHAIINQYYLVKFCACTQTSELRSFVSLHVEPACRTLIYNLPIQS